jgi:hypothetical protein
MERVFVICLIVVFLFTSCYSQRIIYKKDIAADTTYQYVTIEMNDSTSLNFDSFRYSIVDDSLNYLGLQNNNYSYSNGKLAYTDIKLLKIREIDYLLTFLLSGGIVVLVVLVHRHIQMENSLFSGELL